MAGDGIEHSCPGLPPLFLCPQEISLGITRVYIVIIIISGHILTISGDRGITDLNSSDSKNSATGSFSSILSTSSWRISVLTLKTGLPPA